MDKIGNELMHALHALYGQTVRIGGYGARQEIEKILTPLREDAKRLEPFGFKVYSQNEEDGIIEEIFRRLDINEGRFCEIGVENGLECNTLYLLLKGWRGCWIEGNERQREPILNQFSSLIKSGRLRLNVGLLTAETINSVFEQLGLNQGDLDFVSIDIDGMDIYLFESLKILPKVICIEYNAKFPPPAFKKPVYNASFVWKGTDYMGSSLVALNEVAGRKGYSLVATNITGSNAFFVRKDLLGSAFVSDPTPEKLYNPARYWLTFDHFAYIGHRADFGPYTDLVDK